MTDVVYGRRAVREALRGRREVGQVWCAARSARDARLAAASGRAVEAAAAASTERAGSPDHQGVVAEVAPYPLRRARPSSSPASARWSSRSTRSPTRTTWAPSPGWPSAPGADGLVITRRRSAPGDAGRLPRVGGRGRAPAGSRGSRTWPISCSTCAGPGLWSYAAAAELGDAPRPRRLPRRRRVRARGRGARAAAAGAGGLRPGGRRSRCGGRVESLNVSHRGGGAALRGGAAARWRLSSTSSTATTSATCAARARTTCAPASCSSPRSSGYMAAGRHRRRARVRRAWPHARDRPHAGDTFRPRDRRHRDRATGVPQRRRRSAR